MTSLLPGTEVRARGLRWEVVTSDSLGPQTLYRLRCMDSALRGQELDLLSPFEQIEPIVRDLRPDRAAPLSNWLVYHQAFLLEQALGPHALLAAQPGRLRLEPYQLVPVIRALRMSRVRLLLADGVGLGKTIQAGLVITELIARRVAHRVLVVSPAGPLLEQWRMELAERFGLRMRIIDRAAIEQIRRETELGANPFDHIPLALVSIDFLKQERMLEQLERASYDVVVLDEAHHCMDLGNAQEREDSQRRRLAEVLARRCDTLLLLTATPHDGNDRSFASLCELLDPSLVDGRGMLRGERYRAHVIRRLKRHIVDPITKQPRFRERVVLPRPVIASPPQHAAYMELQRKLLALVAPELRRAFRTKSYSDVLAYLALLKRSVSTAAACRETLQTVGDRRQEIMKGVAESQDSRRQRRRTLQDIQRRLERFGAISVEEELAQQQLQAEDLTQLLTDMQREITSGSGRQRHMANVVDALDELTTLAAAAEERDPKLDQLITEIRTIRAAEPQANVLIYTEYTDSQRAVVKALERAGVGAVVTMSGEDNESRRGDITERFRTSDNLILISTDAAAEGLNLHQHCHHLIHLELPFNPNRLEQRNGRIDRYGQEHDPIVRYLYLRGTFEERILLRLIAKYERQRTRLTFVPNTLGLTASTDASAARLLQGLMDDDDRLFRSEPTPVDFTSETEATGVDPATRDLLEEIDRSLRSFEQAARTNAWLGDTGLAADDQTLADANQAQVQGARSGGVDLVQFVLDSVRLDGGIVRPTADPRVTELLLPTGWQHGLNDLPGYDASTHIVRLTTDLELTRDAWDNPVGYLGRAHPLVRRAIDRVRNLSFGSGSEHAQDLRASVVIGDVSTPTLLFTMLGRVESRVGRELEQVIAVQCEVSGVSSTEQASPSNMTYTCHLDPTSWLPLANLARATRTTGVYERDFLTWFAPAAEQARMVAAHGFAPIGEGFIKERQRELEAERHRQDEWLRQRTSEILPVVQVPSAQQLSLFGATAADLPTLETHAPWQTLTDSVARLAAFHGDASQPARLRSEADGVLRIYRQRIADLEARLTLRAPEVMLLGVLMIVPGFVA